MADGAGGGRAGMRPAPGPGRRRVASGCRGDHMQRVEPEGGLAREESL